VEEIENDTAGKPADSTLTNTTSDGRNQIGRPRGPVKRPRIDLPDGDQLWPYYTDFAQDTGINRRSLQRMLKDVPTTVAIDPEWGISPSEIGVQYQPDGRLSTFPKNTATFTGRLLIVSRSRLVCPGPYVTVPLSVGCVPIFSYLSGGRIS
jgi:hypothetical protein